MQLDLVEIPKPPRPAPDGPRGVAWVRMMLSRLEALEARIERAAKHESDVFYTRAQRRERFRSDGRPDGRARRWLSLWTRRLRDAAAYRRRLERERRAITRRLVEADAAREAARVDQVDP